MTTQHIDILKDELPQDCAQAAHWWYEFGFTVAPMNLETKHTALKWPAWTHTLKAKGHDAIDDEFSKKDYGLCAIVDSNLFILDADTPESKAALYNLESAFDLTPNLIVQTRNGEHHYFRKAPGTYAYMAGFSSEKEPNKIDVRTGRTLTEGRSVIVLPPSPGKVIVTNEAESVADLVEVGQDFIDAVFRHNGQEPPREMPERTAPEVKRVIGESEAKEILSWIPADGGYDDWRTVLMGTHEKYRGGMEGLYLVDAWSSQASNYCGFEELEYKWRSFNADREKVVTWSSVCELARSHGADLSEIANSYNPDGTKRRTYDDILADARSMDQETEAEAIESLVAECRPLSAIHRRKVFDAIKDSTGTPLGDLKAALKESSEKESPELDQLALAHQVVADIGPENILGEQSFVWGWSGQGVWEKLEDRTIKQAVQEYIPAKVEAVGKTLVDGVTDLLKTTVYRPHHDFNVGPPDVVNCLNGELHLIDGQWVLKEHNREHYRTSQLSIEYDPQARAPRFTQFMDEVFKRDQDAAEKTQALLEMMGYSLMSHCAHEKFIVLIGGGANGKSVLLQVLEKLAGSRNVAGVQPSEFGNKFQRARLHGKLVNIVSELKQGAVIDDEALKGITSGEITTVEHKHRDPFEMHPFSTCWFGTNHMPHTRDFSGAMFRRALLVEFNNTFKPELGNCDPGLKEKLADELPGILNMALTAYAEALQSGFTNPASSKRAIQQWQLEADQVAQFVEEECVRNEIDHEKSKELYGAYADWAKESGIKQTVNAKSFKDRMERLGFVYSKRNDGRHYLGVSCNRIRQPAY